MSFRAVFLLTLIITIKTSMQTSDQPLLLVISLDGFRPDYFSETLTPNMIKFRENGVYSDYMDNVWPTFTFVNHWSAITGLYPGTHGVLANKVYDHRSKRELGYGRELFTQNPTTVPIFIMNQLNGQHSGTMMWPGGEFAYTEQQIRSTFAVPLKKTPWNERVDTVVSWFKHDVTPTNLVTMYVNEPDDHGHSHGPDSDEEKDTIRQVDKYVKYIDDKLEEEGLSDRVNVIYISDHGMDTLILSNCMDITKGLQNDTYDIYGLSPVLQVAPRPGFEEDVLLKLHKMSAESGKFKVYTRDNIPMEWRLNNTDRFGPILVVAESQYAFKDQFGLAEWVEQTYKKPVSLTATYGIHGYANNEKMRAMFMAKGPVFKKGIKSDVFRNVDLYQLFCRILKIECIQTEGEDRTTIWNKILND